MSFDDEPQGKHGGVRITRTPEGVELYFPPLRMPEVALPLAAFGVIAAVIPGVAVVALAPAAAADAGSLLSAALIAGFVLPFIVFGAMFVVLALYMVANALLVRIRSEGIETARILFGVVVKRHRIARSDIDTLEPEIASRYQSLFSADPVYQLVARARDRRRIVVGETLRGEPAMTRIKALLEDPFARA
jgi:hypothetical protein